MTKKKKKKRERETIRTIIKELTFLSLKSQKRGKLWNFLKKYLNKYWTKLSKFGERYKFIAVRI